MKNLIKRTDLISLWEEDGDLKRMKDFFNIIEADSSEKNEQIKQIIKQKVLEKIKKEERVGLPATGKIGLVHRMRNRFRIGGWKLGFSVAGLALLVLVGQGALNASSWHLIPRMGSAAQEKHQIVGRAPQSTGTLSTEDRNQINGGEPNESSILSKAKAGATQNEASSYSTAAPATKDNAVAPLPPVQIPPSQDVPPADASIPRKITHDLSLTLEVETVSDTVAKISSEVQQLGGYVSESQQSESDNRSSAQMTVKIPAEKLNGLRDSLSTWGKVLDQRMVANDITNQYFDSQVRMQTLEAEEKRYLEILNQAKTIDDVLKVENSLGNTRQQIEQLKGQLKLWNHQIDYSTINLQLVTLQSPNIIVNNPWQPIAWSKTWKATRDAVLKTVSYTWNILNYFVIGLGYALPFLFISVIVWVLYRIWKRRNIE